MNTKICQDCLFFKSNSDRQKICQKKGYIVELMDHCPLGITLEDIKNIETLCEIDGKYGVLYVLK